MPHDEVASELRDCSWTAAEEFQPAAFPVLAPPAIRKGDLALCQTSVCTAYSYLAAVLAKLFGLYPAASPEVGAKAEQLVASAREHIVEAASPFKKTRPVAGP